MITATNSIPNVNKHVKASHVTIWPPPYYRASRLLPSCAVQNSVTTPCMIVYHTFVLLKRVFGQKLLYTCYTIYLIEHQHKWKTSCYLAFYLRSVIYAVYGLSDNICCSVHALLWTFPCLSILVRLRLPRLGQPAEISIQRWTFCKDIALLMIGRGVVDWIVGYCLVHNKKVNCAFYNRNQSKKQS